MSPGQSDEVPFVSVARLIPLTHSHEQTERYVVQSVDLLCNCYNVSSSVQH